MDIEECIFVGIVSSYGQTDGTVIVRRPDKDNRTTAELKVISRCTQKTKDYWMPDIDEQVVCLMLPNAGGKGAGAGFVLGAVYSEADPPAEKDTSTRSVRYKDGSYIVNKGGAMTIHASKSLTITAPKININ